MYAIQTNVYALFIVIIILMSLHLQKDLSLKLHRYFYAMLYVTAILLFSDLISESTNGKSGFVFVFLHYFSTYMLYAASGFLGAFWLFYAYDYINQQKPIHWVRKVLFLFPAFLMALFALLSLFMDFMFYIDADNLYHRGTYFYINAVILYSYIFFVFILIFRHYKKLTKIDAVPLISIPLFPAIGGLIQVIFYGTLLTWPMATLSLLIVYIFIQSKIVGIDSMTHLLNRRAFYHKVKDINRMKHIKENIGCIMLDVNHFKHINDTYGHHIGDEVLKTLGYVFKRVFEPVKTIYRIGGDEFFILLSVDNEQSFDSVLDQLNDEIKTIKTFDFDISVSIGSGLYNRTTHPDFEKFIVHLDQLMYQNKSKNALNKSHDVNN